MSEAKPPLVLEGDWKALVAEFENTEAPVPSYEFSRRTFYETKYSGVYNTENEE